ncbi:MAG: c-type cytochrome [Acidiferrobacteraceae bacterium]
MMFSRPRGRQTILGTGAILLLTGSAYAAKAPPALVTSVCAACHGVNGIAVMHTDPNLAGQLAPYLAAQIRAFKNHTRADPAAQSTMWGIAATIPDNEISKIAHYFANQKGPRPGIEPAALVSEGRKIYVGGIPNTNTPACMNCHGPNGRGLPPTFPRLAGQNVAYVTTQLGYFKQGLRTNGSSNIMHTIASKLTAREMSAVAAFVRTQ